MVLIRKYALPLVTPMQIQPVKDRQTREDNSDILLFTAQIQTIKQYKYHQLMCEAAQIPRIVENAFLRLSS